MPLINEVVNLNSNSFNEYVLISSSYKKAI